MAQARAAERWNHTAALLALIANTHRDPHKRRPFVPADFLPSQRTASPPPVTDLSILRAVFVDRRTPEMPS